MNCEHFHFMPSSADFNEVECLDCGAIGFVEWETDEDEYVFCGHSETFRAEDGYSEFCAFCGDYVGEANE